MTHPALYLSARQRRLLRIMLATTIYSLIAWSLCSAQTATLTPSPYQLVTDSNNAPVNLACVWTYVAGTTTPATTYSDTSGTTNSNPIIVPATGRYVAYLTPGSSYKVVYENPPCSASAHGSTILSQDNIGAIPASAANVDVLGTAGEAITAGNVVYLSDGSGSKNAGQWYKADAGNAYSSATPQIGIAPNAISSGAMGSVRLAGTATNLPAMVVGAIYYVGSAGALTNAPANPTAPRKVGQADTTSSLIFPAIDRTVDNAVDDFRLTLTSGTCVTTGDVTAATTIYFAPCKGNRIALYDSSGNGTYYTSPQISIAVPNTTSQMYDLFVYANGSTPTLEALAWTNDTTRATALVQNVALGVYTKSGDATRRYVGSFRTTGVSGQTEDSAAKRFLYNYYNRVPQVLRVADSTDSWTYTTAAWHQANASAANQVAVVIGIAEHLVDLRLIASAANSTAATSFWVGIGEDSTSAIATNDMTAQMSNDADTANVIVFTAADLTTAPAVGYHFYAWLEQGNGVGTLTWYGDNGAPTRQRSGLMGTLR